MDEIGNSGSFQPSSPVMESPLMQLANASVSVMRASLSPKEIKNSGVESKSSLSPKEIENSGVESKSSLSPKEINNSGVESKSSLSPKEINNSGVESKSSPYPALHSIRSSVNTDPQISLLSNSNIDSFARTHVPLEDTVPSVSNPSPDKHIKKTGTTSLIVVGTENPVLENITTPQISKHGHFSPQVTGANLEVTTQSDSHKEHIRYSLPLDGSIVNVTKSSVSRILTSDLSESIFTTSDMISAVAAGDVITKKTNNPKDFVSQQTSPQPMLPRLIPLPSQINKTNPQTENVPVKTSILKFTTCENEKSISLQPSKSIPKTSYTAMQSLQSGPLTQKNTKAFANSNPVSVCTVTQEIHKDTNSSPQIKHLSNAGLTPVSNIICSLPSKNPFVLPVTASSTPTEIVQHSRPLLQLHTITQTSTTHSLLNKHSHLKESQNISENMTNTSEIISSNTSVDVPTIHTSSVKPIPSFPQIPFPAKSCDNFSPCTTAIGTDVSGKKTNLPSTNISSVNFVSKIDKKDIASCSSSVRAVQVKADVEIPSKLSFPVASANVVYCSSEEVNTLAASKSSLAKNADTNLVSVCTVDSVVAFCTPTVITTTPAITSTAKCNPNSVTHTLSASSTHNTTFSTSASVASCTGPAPIIGPHIVAGSLTTATCTPSDAPSFLSLTTGTLPTTCTTVPSTNMPLTTPTCDSSTFMYTPGIATSTLITTSLTTATTTSTLAVTTCIPVTTVQSPKEFAIAQTEAPFTIERSEAPPSSLNQLSSAPDESFGIVIKPSDEKASGCKSLIDQLSRNGTNMDSSVKQSSSTRITETYAISNTASDCMTTLSPSPDSCVPFSDQKSASASLISTVVSVVSDNMKKNLLTNKNNSNLSSPVVSDKSELDPLPKKLLKKSKPPEKESKFHTVSNTCALSNSSALSNSTLPSTISKEEPVSSDLLNLSPSYPKFTSLLKENLTISSNEKNKSLISTVNTETAAVSTKGSAPTKIEGCSISTRPRRTIKARHLFSSSAYSTGSTKSDCAGESSSSSSRQRKRIITPSTDEEEKKGSSSNAIKKKHTNKTAKDEETCSRLKKPVRRRILPAVKADSGNASKNCLLIKASPNIAQVPSDISVPPGYTYLLTALSLTTAEKDSVKIVKTPTMASNSGVTSTSPTYCNSKRNVTTKCSTIKEQKSPDLTFVETDKTCTDSLISSSRKSTSQKIWSISPVNYTGNTSDDSLEDSNESDTLQNSAEISLSRKRKISTSDVNAASNSLSPKSCEDLSQQIAEAERFIKKEPIEVTEVDQSVTENNAEASSQNSSEVCAPTRVTREIRKLLNAGSSNNKVSLVQDLISSSPGNNLSQTRPLAPVQLSSPYAIFLPVSLASGATTTVTTPPASAPLYSIQLNVPNVVRMGKPFLPNDGSITKKHCTIIPAITCPKTDNSSMKSNLISRNNLIATYYPAPLPESLMNKITVSYHACGECGDTFLFKSSLNAHKTRKCMQLTYNCDNCTMKLVFYNKCSVLEHIRSHYPTRPVTIKLDRMEVIPLPEGITDVLEMEDESESSYRDPEEATKFDCTECGAKFHSARALADHFGHSEVVCSFTFYCALCQTYLPRHCAQLAHRRVHHEKPPHVCPECGQLISNLFSFREHLKYKCMHFSRIAPLMCPKCPMSKFCYTPELKEHIISVHSETFIKCSICPMAFKASASYQAHHQNTHASELEQKKEIYKCPLCDTVFHSIQQLMNHVDVHIGELKKDISYAFRCSICFSIFAKRSQLVSHLGSSHNLDYVQHRCEFCDCVCKTAHNLQTHQRAIHKVELKKFELSKSGKMKGESAAAAKSKKMKIGDVTHCSLCHIFFATLPQLQMHTMKVHQKKMNDSLPDSGTSLSSALVPINKNSQKFCRYCKAPYKSWSRLMQHILGHRNSGVYICLICTCAAFISKEELSKHEEFCSGENLHDKPPAVYECEECHQLFKQESWLIAHQKNIHPKKGAFTCDLCDLPYKSNSSLQKHMQTVHEGKMSFYCYECKEMNKEKVFRCQSQLEKHLMTKHKMSLNQMKMKQSNVEEKNNKNSSLSEELSDKNKQAASGSPDAVPAKKSKLATTKKETYICAKCNFTSQNSDIFQLHIQDHKTSEDGIQCSICGLCFAAVDSLRMHLFAVHKIKRSNDSLRDQGVNKSPVSKVLEDISPSTVVQSSTTNTLLTIEASESTTTVAVVSVSKESKLMKLTSDTNSDSNLLSCQCNVCYKMFETEHLLKVHMRTHGMAFIRSKRLTMSE